MTDISIGNWVMSPKRIEFAKFTTPLKYTNILSIISIDQKVKSNFKIFTTFEPITWWLLIISLLLISLVNIKSRKNFLINFFISLIDHFECLLTKKVRVNLTKLKLIVLLLKLVHFHQIEFINHHICFGLSLHFSW